MYSARQCLYIHIKGEWIKKQGGEDMNQFTEKERMILQTFEKTLPKMSEMEK